MTREKPNKVFLDFEFIESVDRTSQKTICCSTRTPPEKTKFWDLRGDQSIFKNFIVTLPQKTPMLSFNIAAEVVSLLRMGIPVETLRNFHWVDLWVEAKMFLLTHPRLQSKETSLKGGVVPKFKLNYPFDMKLDPIEVILKGNGTYTDEEWELIKKYNEADVEVLDELLEKLKMLWSKYGITYEEVLFRGSVAFENAYQYWLSNGFPMDVDFLKKVFENREEVKYQVAKECNEKIGFDIYYAKTKSRPKEMSFNLANFEKFLEHYGLLQTWDKTCDEGDTNKNGKLKKVRASTTEDAFEKWMEVDSFLSANKVQLETIYYARSTIRQLNSTNLYELLSPEGYIKAPPFVFHQKSGRSSPKPKLGFILNLAPWLRMTIKPKEGMAFISADWSQQEVALAGFFSGDEKLKKSYKYDHYLINAREMGFIPPINIEHLKDTLDPKEFDEQVKKPNKKMRDLMKSPSLGIIYGMALKTLAFKVESENGWVHDTDRTPVDLWTVVDGEFIKRTVTVSTRAWQTATKFYYGHKETYPTYWNYVETHAWNSKERGYYKTPVSGWMYFTRPDHKPTQLQNIPNQAGGAVVMQLGYVIASKKYGLRIVCSLHDALYVECKIEEIEETKRKLLAAMKEAVDIFSNNTLEIRNEVSVYTSDKTYYDVRGVTTYELIKKLFS